MEKTKISYTLTNSSPNKTVATTKHKISISSRLKNKHV